MYHLVIENLGEKRCIATSEQDNFSEGMYADCTLDNGCIPDNYIREISILCAGDKPVRVKAVIYRD